MPIAAKIAGLVATEIFLLVTPMMWPTIPVAWGYVLYGGAAALAVFAVASWAKGAWFNGPKRITAAQAVRYLSEESEWGRDAANNPVLALEDAARRGSIRSWGQSCLNYLIVAGEPMFSADSYSFTGNVAEIPIDDWRRMRFDPRSLKTIRPNWAVRHMTEPTTPNEGEPSYGYIEFDPRELKKIWPPLR